VSPLYVADGTVIELGSVKLFKIVKSVIVVFFKELLSVVPVCEIYAD
jgi:hypothetical protein